MNSDPLLQILWKTEKRIINIDEIYTVNGIINDSKCEKNLSFLIKKKKKRLWTASVTHTTQIIKLILK